MNKKQIIPIPHQTVNTQEGFKKYYLGIPETLAGSTLRNGTKDTNSKVVKQGMKSKTSQRTYTIKNEGRLPNNSQF